MEVDQQISDLTKRQRRPLKAQLAKNHGVAQFVQSLGTGIWVNTELQRSDCSIQSGT